MVFAEVILPLPLANTFTYRLPESLARQVKPLCRVVAPFGSKRSYTGVVVEIHSHPPAGDFEIKEITALVDESPVIREPQLAFWKWIADYYLCSLGEVYRAAIPSAALKMEPCVCLPPAIRSEEEIRAALSTLKKGGKQEKLLLDYLEISQRGGVTVSRKELLDYSRAGSATLRFLTARKILAVEKRRVNRVSIPKTAALTESVNPPSPPVNPPSTPVSPLSPPVSPPPSPVNPPSPPVSPPSPPINSPPTPVSPPPTPVNSPSPPVALTATQQKALSEIRASFEQKDVTLLHGVAASGKTEIYIKLIAEELSRGRQVLYLLPEITVTAQTTARLQGTFGSRLLAYHSGLSENERAGLWNLMLQSDEPRVVVGVRSSLFLPFSRLGLIIVSEENDPSYKQQEPAPRYHARNSALILARYYGAKTLLGSATPSLESYLLGTSGKYGFVSLENRYYSGKLPEIHVVNVSELRRKKQMKASSCLSPLLREKMSEALSSGRQVLLLQNRRGFASVHVCCNCQEISRCPHCGVSLTYHKRLQRLSCHYCGYSAALPPQCPVCGSGEMKLSGFGVEKVEEEVASLFPSARAIRLDIDSARTKNAAEQIMGNFKSGEASVLIGTQMASRVFNFANVGVVGVINADGIMNMPDFRAYERAFHLFSQAGNAAGRDGNAGCVVLQTTQLQTSASQRIEHPLLQLVQQRDYRKMAKIQLKERHDLHYPPYTRLIIAVMRCKNEKILDSASRQYADMLKKSFGYRVSDIIHPHIALVQFLFVREIMIKMELTDSVAETRRILERLRSAIQSNPAFRNVLFHYNVDPN